MPSDFIHMSYDWAQVYFGNGDEFVYAPRDSAWTTVGGSSRFRGAPATTVIACAIIVGSLLFNSVMTLKNVRKEVTSVDPTPQET